MRRKEHIWIDGVEYKECGRCKEVKTLDNFSKTKSNWDGLNNTCKQCQKEYREKNKERINQKNREYWAKNKDRLNAQRRERRKNNPQEVREVQRKWYWNNHKRILELKRKWYWSNREKDLESSRKWREKNKEYKAEYDRQYYEKNKEKIAEYKKQWQKENKERINARNRERYKSDPNYRASIKASYHKREALKRNVLATMTDEEWLECQNYFKDENGNLRCAYCNKVIEVATVEHFIPIAKGGTLTKENVLPACLSCNTSKQDKDFFEWYPQQEFYSKEREEKILEYLGYNQNQQLSIL